MKFKQTLLIALSIIATIALFCLGQHAEASGIMTASIPAISLSEAEKAGFNEGEKKMIGAVEKLVNEVNGKIKDGAITKAEVEAMLSGIKSAANNEEVAALKSKLEQMEAVAKDQGTSLATMQQKLQFGGNVYKSIGQVLQENESELKRVYQQGSGAKTFMLYQNHKNEWVMTPFDGTKAAGPHATIADVGGAGNNASISQSIDASTLLRLGGNSQIISNYRNNAWVFDLVNIVNAGFDMPFAMWYEEQAKQGSSAVVAEGGSKPLVQYAYALKSSAYKKQAALIGFTDEFSLDFQRLQDDILNKGRTDVINGINSNILTNITSAATAYNTHLEFNNAVAISNANEFDVIAAMAAQVDNATFGSLANAAVMSTFKKYRIGINKSTTNVYVDRPSVIDNIAFVGNPAVGTDAIMVGDFKQYNVILRGGFIVKVGYNGTDFAENRFSVVMEQYYYDYISAIRAAAIVKGPDFATVKTALAATT